MKWIEIKIITTEEASEAVSEMLTGIGSGGVSIEDPNDIRKEISKLDSLDYADKEFLGGLGDDVIIKAYFQGDRNVIELTELVKEKISFISNFLDTGKGYSGYSEVDDEDWATSWKKYYKPFKISERLTIKPSWEMYDKSDNEIVIELDPGMAFGTGTHETTKMCSQFIEKYVKPGDTVIDVGCGTGILSIAAAKLGAKHITAIDVDEVAVRITKENCMLNDVNEQIHAVKGVLKEINIEKVDIVVANIIADVIINLAETIPQYLNSGGFMITSGIIKERKQEVIDAYINQKFEFKEDLEMGEWVAMVFKCQDSL